MRGPTPEQMLDYLEQQAISYRQANRWSSLYQTIAHILQILKSFPDIKEESEKEVARYEQELRELEQMLGSEFFKDGNLLGSKLGVMTQELRELFEKGAAEAEIRRKIEIFLIFADSIPERLKDAAFIAHFEDVNTALQLWEAHLHAVWCCAATHSSGFHRPPFSVNTCRIPDWVLELWEGASTQQRYKIVERLLLICELSDRFEQWIALEDYTEWLQEVRRWLVWRGCWQAARRIKGLIHKIEKRKQHYAQEGVESVFWLLPK